MKRFLLSLVVFGLFAYAAFAQNLKIENVRIDLSSTNDSMIVTYDLIGQTPAHSIQLEVIKDNGDPLATQHVSGELGKSIEPGLNKTILWDMAADSADLFGSHLVVQVTGDFVVEYFAQQKQIWIPWFYIASGVSAMTGIYANYRSNKLYEQYQINAVSLESELYHKDIRSLETLRNSAFIAAGIFGTIGVVVHVKHHQKMHAISLNYFPQPQGAQFGLTYNF